MADTTQKVNLVGPDGEVRSFDSVTAQEAVESGAYRVADPEETHRQKLENEFGGDAWEAFGYGALRDASLTLSDYVLGSVGGPEMKRRLAAYKEIHPGATSAGELLGGIGSLALGGLGAAGKAVGAGAKALGAIGRVASSPLKSRLAKAVVGAGVEGGVFGGLYEASDSYLRDVPINGERLFSAAASGALFTAAVGGTLHGITGGLGKKGVSAKAYNVYDDVARGKTPVTMVDDFLEWRLNKMANKSKIAKHNVGEFVDLSDPKNYKLAQEAPEMSRKIGESTGRKLNSGLDTLKDVHVRVVNDLRESASKRISGKTEEGVMDELLPLVKEQQSRLFMASDDALTDNTINWDALAHEKFSKEVNKRVDAFERSVFEKPKVKDLANLDEPALKLKVSPDEAYRKAYNLVSSIEDYAGKLEAKNPNLGSKFSEIVSDAARGQSGKKLFGDAVRDLSEANRLSREFSEVVDALNKSNLTTRGRFDEAYKGWLLRRKNGALDIAESDSGRAFLALRDASFKFEEFLEANRGTVGERYLEKIRRVNEDFAVTFDEVEHMKVAAKQYWARQDAMLADREKLAATAQEATVVREGVQAGGAGIAAATGAVGMLPVGYVGGSVAGAAYRFANQPIMMIETAARVKGFLAKRAQKTADVIESLDRKSIPSGRKVRQPKTPKGKSLYVIPLIKDGDREEEYNKVLDSFQGTVGKETLMRKELMDLSNNNPALTSGIEGAIAASNRARDFMMQLAVSRSLGIKPSKSEMAKVFGAVQGIKWPERVLSKTISGDITKAEADAFKAVYPNEYRNIKELLLNKVQEIELSGKTLPFKTRVKLAIVFGIDMDEKMSIRYMKEMAESRASQQQQQNPQQSRRSTAVPQLHELYEERSEVIGNGGEYRGGS